MLGAFINALQNYPDVEQRFISCPVQVVHVYMKYEPVQIKSIWLTQHLRD